MAAEIRITKRVNHDKARYCVDLRGHGGGRHFFTSKEAAQSFADDKGFEVQQFGREALVFDNDKRIRFYRAEQQLAEVNATIEDAVEYYLKQKAGLTHKAMETACSDYWQAKERANCRDRYVSLIKSTVGHLVRSVGALHVHEVTRETIEAWLHSNRWSANTQGHYLSTVGSFFEWCRARGWCKQNPCKSVDAPMVDDVPPGILAIDHCTVLLKRLLQPKHKSMVAFVAVQLFAGLRPIEALRLRQEDIGKGFIEVKGKKAKTRERRIVKIEPVLAAWLKLGGDLPPKNWRTLLLRLRYDAPKTINTKGNRKQWREVIPWPHDCLRHSFCSYHLAAFKNAATTAIEAGHTEQMLFKHYRELVRPDDAKKFWKLNPITVDSIDAPCK